MIMLFRSFATLGALLISVVGFNAHAASKTLEYTVLRDGAPIGTHAYTIDNNGNNTQVTVTTNIQVKALFFTVYKFVHKSEETWTDGKLVSMTSTTDDDGINKTLKATAENGKITLDSITRKQNRRQFAAATAIPASLWNPAIVTQTTIINTLDGQLMNVRIADLGVEQVEAGGATVAANHYQIKGELTRDLWYNPAGNLVRMSFPDKTNTEIIYSLN